MVTAMGRLRSGWNDGVMEVFHHKGLVFQEDERHIWGRGLKKKILIGSVGYLLHGSDAV